MADTMFIALSTVVVSIPFGSRLLLQQKGRFFHVELETHVLCVRLMCAEI